MLDDGRIVHNQVSYSALDSSELGVLGSQSSSNTESESEQTDDEKPGASQPATVEPESLGAEAEADLSRQTGDIECYKIYLSAFGPLLLFSFVGTLIAYAGFSKMPQIWLRLWVERGTGSRDAGYLGGYIGFALGACMFGTVATAIIMIEGVPRAGQRLHSKLLGTVIRAPLRFFTTVDSGITLNRFSQDITQIDEVLPMAFFSTCAIGLGVLAQIGLIASGATYVAAIIPACIFVLYLVQKFYLRTSRQMRLLDIEMKAPLYTQYTETLAGLSTIRAFGWSGAFLIDSHRRLDVSQRPVYTLYCIQRWLQVVLDLFVLGVALVLVSFSLTMAGSTSSGAIGLALVNLIGFNQGLTALVEQWTELETSLGAIARLKWFDENTPDENKEAESDAPPSEWPAQGAIEFDNVSASYSDESPIVLHNLSFKIKPGQKVGICGRSGSGKSSTILTLLHLLELRSGTIRIDGIDLSTMPRQTIRAHLTTLPQDPVQLTGTIRHNLDPETLISADEPLISSLRKVSLWDTISARGGLDATLEDLGLSAGQLQLLCLARALLARGKIVLVDEATSSVDHATEGEIRRVVAEEMAGRTVVEVAHRLEVVRGCDVVVVMAEGRVAEVGEPEELLRSSGSAFKALWDSQGL